MPTLREARAAKVLTIRGLASVAGVSPQTITDVEAGRLIPRFATIRKIAGALGLAPSEIREFASAIERAAHRRPDATDAPA